ncbi:uncharacterized protein ARMOST_09922 [Armillaria ostoyae]|uniref:Uncharacterized protein n=1 Tax=Armillaria ostoyae TaxID=47428 RepID=A0A284RCV4_ARMOS|nr:uncharacterized protein ARMOST_09922 [Armillaria ostoyae]
MMIEHKSNKLNQLLSHQCLPNPRLYSFQLYVAVIRRRDRGAATFQGQRNSWTPSGTVPCNDDDDDDDTRYPDDTR